MHMLTVYFSCDLYKPVSNQKIVFVLVKVNTIEKKNKNADTEQYLLQIITSIILLFILRRPYTKCRLKN